MARITTCDEAEPILRHYVSALSICRKAVLSAVGLNDSPRYNEVLELKERAFRMLARGREDYWNHVSKHGCRHSEMAAQRRTLRLTRRRIQGAIRLHLSGMREDGARIPRPLRE